jgi:hypothetical protein
MKLVLCGSCYDLFKLDFDLRTCKCGKSSGAYESDGWHAWYSGKAAFPLGILNESLRKAIVESAIAPEETEISPLLCLTVPMSGSSGNQR